MQLLCEGHSQLRGLSEGLRPVLQRPKVLDEPVLQGDSDPDASGASIYGSVIRDGGIFRMWYQAWPRDWDGKDVAAVACAESDDGLTWRRPDYGLISCCGTQERHGWAGSGVDIKAMRQGTLGKGGFGRIGLARWPRDRVMGFEAVLQERLLLSSRQGEEGNPCLTVNAKVHPGGMVRAALLGADHNPIPGYSLEDCDSFSGDHLGAVIRWKGNREGPAVAGGQALTAELEITDGTIYAFDFVLPGERTAPGVA